MKIFEDYLQTQGNFTSDEIQQIIAASEKRLLQRNDFVLRNGEICRHKVFISGGLLRNFALTSEGYEQILQFSPENTWTLDVESYDKETPARYNIAAVEKSQILLWAKSDFNRLLSEIPTLKSLSQHLISQNIYNSRQRLLTTLSATPEQKYDDFLKSSPGLLTRLPLHMIASYLGMSLKTLTRIRHAQILR